MNPLLACVALCLASLVTAQDTAAKPDLKAKHALLTKACTAMAELPSGSFTTEQKTDSPMVRAIRGAAGGADPKSVIAGTWGPGLLAASCDNGADELVWAGRRMIAREKDGSWKLRHGVLHDGRPLPQVVDPCAAFAVLACAKLDVIHSEVGSFEDRPVEIVTAHVEGDVARDLRHAGVLPEGTDTMGGGMVVFRAAGVGGRMMAPQLDVTADLAFFIDPATQRIHQLRIKTYTKSAGMGGIRVAVAGGAVVAGGAEEEEDEDEADPKSPLAFKNGLPVRKVKKDQTTTSTYELKFGDHGKATLPELDASARELLGIGATK